GLLEAQMHGPNLPNAAESLQPHLGSSSDPWSYNFMGDNYGQYVAPARTPEEIAAEQAEITPPAARTQASQPLADRLREAIRYARNFPNPNEPAGPKGQWSDRLGRALMTYGEKVFTWLGKSYKGLGTYEDLYNSLKASYDSAPQGWKDMLAAGRLGQLNKAKNLSAAAKALRDNLTDLNARGELLNAMPVPGSFAPDDNTLRLVQIPGGLERVIGDIHAHPWGYDRRDPSGTPYLAIKGG